MDGSLYIRIYYSLCFYKYNIPIYVVPIKVVRVGNTCGILPQECAATKARALEELAQLEGFGSLPEVSSREALIPYQDYSMLS